MTVGGGHVAEESKCEFTRNMLLTLIIWLMVGCAAWGYGRIFFTVRRCEESRNNNVAPESLAVRLYVGLLCLVCLLAAAAIFIPVRWWIGLLALSLGVLIRPRHRGDAPAGVERLELAHRRREHDGLELGERLHTRRPAIA